MHAALAYRRLDTFSRMFAAHLAAAQASDADDREWAHVTLRFAASGRPRPAQLRR
jgi:hypothetical protein